jgi:hypothetical protein
MFDPRAENRDAFMHVMMITSFNWGCLPYDARLKFDPIKSEVSVINCVGDRVSIPRAYITDIDRLLTAAREMLAIDRGVEPVIITRSEYMRYLEIHRPNCGDPFIKKPEKQTFEEDLAEIERILEENADLSQKISENNKKLVKLRENLSKRLKNAGILNEKCHFDGSGYYPNSICYVGKQARF